MIKIQKISHLHNDSCDENPYLSDEEKSALTTFEKHLYSGKILKIKNFPKLLSNRYLVTKNL